MLVIDGDTSLLRPVEDNDMTLTGEEALLWIWSISFLKVSESLILSEWSPERPMVTSTVQLHILEIGPYTGNAFGGIESIDIYGCYKKDQYLITSNQNEKDLVTEKQVLDPTEIKVNKVSGNMNYFVITFRFRSSLPLKAWEGLLLEMTCSTLIILSLCQPSGMMGTVAQ